MGRGALGCGGLAAGVVQVGKGEKKRLQHGWLDVQSLAAKRPNREILGRLDEAPYGHIRKPKAHRTKCSPLV